MNNEGQELSGSVESVIYQNEENGYTVLRLRTEDGGISTVVGCLPFAVSGERLALTGSWAKHPFHGDQFKVQTAERLMPKSVTEITEYLSSGAIKGIGPATARQIVERFGPDSLNVIEEEPERLAEIKGINMKRAREIGASFRRQSSLRRLMEFFAENNVKLYYALRLYKIYGDDARAALMDNPYILTDEFIGADFAEADKLAISMDFDADSPERLQAAVVFELTHNAGNGHTFIPRELLKDAVNQLIHVCGDPVETAIDELIKAGSVICEDIAGRQACYLARLYNAENFVASRIKAMSRVVPLSCDIVPIIDEAESELGIKLADAQRLAVSSAANFGIMALTGGPGTGKTTTVRTILRMFDRMGLSAALTAPTGRAAKRMSELAGRDASTIHRLLETGFDGQSGEPVFKRDSSDPLFNDVIILDEASMVDITLMAALLDAMKPDCRLVMVGDADQLPSVGPGNLFSDVIRSGAVATVRLTEVFRQAEESSIVKNAHLINRGELPDLTENKGDFFFLSRRDGEKAADTIAELCAQRLPEKMAIEPAQIQVLSPTRHYATGTVSLNKRLQEVLNPPAEGKSEKLFGEFVFRCGDRVMQTRNNYDIIWRKQSGESGMGVFNGDVGHISEISTENQTMTVEFDDRQVVYSFDMLADIEPAYAMTIHKSQGSEYRAVILSLVKSARSLISRAILYTAVTRAKDLLIIVGDREMVEAMVKNDKPQRRYSGLKTRLMS
ncbi:MAG: ATP-dependent RecD-like DNA helicase [Clostridiales bacterium]|nr:ATP-dependent RecD-like DNA helicase [Clostridiales bacterium]